MANRIREEWAFLSRKKSICLSIIFSLVSSFLLFDYFFHTTINDKETQPRISWMDEEKKKGVELKEEQYADKEQEKDKRHSVVYLSGAVQKPGLYELNGDITKGELLKETGGAIPYAAVEKINLADPVTEGEHIHVEINWKGTPEELLRDKNINININTSGEEELTKLPGIGEAMAKRIISYRQEKGPFASIEEIKNVKGIGEKNFEKIKDKIEI